jgi:hypothetical protein
MTVSAASVVFLAQNAKNIFRNFVGENIFNIYPRKCSNFSSYVSMLWVLKLPIYSASRFPVWAEAGS